MIINQADPAFKLKVCGTVSVVVRQQFVIVASTVQGALQQKPHFRTVPQQHASVPQKYASIVWGKARHSVSLPLLF